MKKIKWTPVIVTCIILISSWVGMSLAEEPRIVEAEELPEEEVEEIYEAHGSLSITGTAAVDCKPDQLVILLRIKALDHESVAKASDEVAKMLDKLLSSLKKLGISTDDIETTSYDINELYEWTFYENGNRKEQVFKGYQVINKLKVTTKDFDKSGKIIDVAADVGALVDNINFELSREKRNELKIQVMAQAAEDAKLKAEAVITALEEELGRVKSVNLNNYVYQPYKYWDRKTIAFKESYHNESDIIPPTTILPTDLSVSANVNVVFDII